MRFSGLQFGHYSLWIVLILLALIIAEILWSIRHQRHVYNRKETITNTGVLIGFQLSKIVFASYQLGILNAAAGAAVFYFPAKWWVFAITFILADFIYYWFHRASHKWQVLWAFHHIHHSSKFINLTSAYRLNWLSALISPLFFVPLAILGLPPGYIALSYALNLLYQFFLHTEAVDTIKPIEGILDTPSAHRVHHGCNQLYIDKNFAGVFIIWDRLFGTYQPETEKPVYGIKDEPAEYNPFILVFKQFHLLFKPTKK